MRSIRAGWFMLAMVSLALLAVPAAAEPIKARRPNVLIVLTDDLGWADLGCYGCTDIRTPNVDKLARQGVRLTHFYSNGPVCSPTRAALMTGRWQQRVGIEWAISPGQKEPGLPATAPSLARMLKDAGYATGLSGKWHLGYRKEFGPNAHGFDDFFGLLSGNVDHYSHKEINGEPDWYENTKPVQVAGYSTDLITSRAVSFINKHARQPFFHYVAYNAVHWPFQPPGHPDDVRSRDTWFRGTRQDYAAMVEAVDAGVGKILAALDEHHLTENTLVVFTNDNGGERLSDNGPFFHHKGTLWEGGIRVPCILRWPDRLPAGKVNQQPAITMDLTATTLAVCGVALPSDPPLDGVDLLPFMSGKAAVERIFYWRIDRRDRQQWAVRQGKWKYLRDGGIEMLFDLVTDPGERKDLAYGSSEKVDELKRLLAAWETQIARAKPASVVK